MRFSCSLNRLPSIIMGGFVVFGSVSGAYAAGYALKEQSASSLGTAYAGATAGYDDPSAVFYNPASLANLKGNQITAVGAYIAPRADATSADAAFGGVIPVVGSDEGDIAQNAFVPSFYAVLDYSPAINLGLSVNSPFGLVTDYDFESEFRYNALTSNLKTINVSPTVSYKIDDHWAVGGGVQVQYAKARLTRALDCGTAGSGVGLTPQADDCIVDNEGDDIGYGVTAGLQWQDDDTRVGLSYRSNISSELEGETTVDLPSGISAGQAAALRAGLPASQGVTAKINTPETIGIGVSHDLNDRWTIMGDAVWTRWSRFENLTLVFDDGLSGSTVSNTPENWNNVWFFATGAEYQWRENTKFRFGIAYDQSPIDDEFRTERIPGEDRYWLAAGVQYDVNDTVTFDVGYTHIFLDDPKIDLPGDGGSTPALNATYNSGIDILAAQITYKF